MSRIGKLPVPVPTGVDITISTPTAGPTVTVKGPKGTLSHQVAEPISVVQDDGQLLVQRPDESRTAKSLHGLTRTLVANMVTGVTAGYEKTLEIVGTGYRVQARGAELEFALGFSHPVTVVPPEGVTFEVRGIDKQLVGETAAKIRKLRKPDPYKGKGVRYQGEVIRRKAGKTGK